MFVFFLGVVEWIMVFSYFVVRIYFFFYGFVKISSDSINNFLIKYIIYLIERIFVFVNIDCVGYE